MNVRSIDGQGGLGLFVMRAGAAATTLMMAAVAGAGCGGRTLDVGHSDDAAADSVLPANGGSGNRIVDASRAGAPYEASVAGRGGDAGRGDVPDVSTLDAGVGRIPTGVYDPNEVYFVGNLDGANCATSAIAHWSTPNEAVTAFDCGVDKVFGIRPTDGRLIVSRREDDLTTLYAFVPDGNGRGPMPEDPHANDVPIPTGCEEVRRVFLDPDGGELVYYCRGAPPCSGSPCDYTLESGVPFEVPEGYYLAHRGFGGTALLRVSTSALFERHWAVERSDGSVVETDQAFDALTIRAHEGGFWLLESRAEDPEDDGNRLHRWTIDLDGTAVLEGSYPRSEPKSRYIGICAFEGSGALLCLGDSRDLTFDTHILRAELDGELGLVVYAESEDPLVEYPLQLLTGP